jgi:hypothetical protein
MQFPMATVKKNALYIVTLGFYFGTGSSDLNEIFLMCYNIKTFIG